MTGAPDAAALLLRERLAAAVTHDDLAARAGTSRPTISAYEHGRKVPSFTTMQRLLAALGRRLEVEPRITWSTYRTGGGRTAWVPSGLWRLPVSDAFAPVALPLHLNWSAPGRVFAPAARRERLRMYEVLLREGEPDDLERHVDGILLVDAWSELVLPRAVRNAWSPLVRDALAGPDDLAVRPTAS